MTPHPANPPAGTPSDNPAPFSAASAATPPPPWRERVAAALAAGCVIGLTYFYWSA